MALKMTFKDLCDDAKTRIREVEPEEVLARVRETGHDWRLIDVRENDEFRAGHVESALGIGRGVLEYHIADVEPNTDREIVLYCRGGNRSALAADSLQRMGYTNVLSMAGGWKAWEAKGLPVNHEGEPIQH
ncbi:MAG TPA: rhodanese-like domain-containing protein [Armatimonadota bacterium]|jgi:rhodanese-related sulfurtransferase